MLKQRVRLGLKNDFYDPEISVVECFDATRFKGCSEQSFPPFLLLGLNLTEEFAEFAWKLLTRVPGWR